ncbi:hypothetical protein FNV43_RR27335 [Rhamnella rubrinervis]|uniref:Uncharacterized protein n=1 Tax=Rhamnella rubrinervis TaxID=2594499 RepID=A0A8K0GSF6_9ROSA|nr:hypothetical protein FNV43_RR27335 [Rhamnella rubrinervis]
MSWVVAGMLYHFSGVGRGLEIVVAGSVRLSSQIGDRGKAVPSQGIPNEALHMRDIPIEARTMKGISNEAEVVPMQNISKQPSFADSVSGAANTVTTIKQNAQTRKGNFVSILVNNVGYQERLVFIISDLARGIGVPLKIDNATLTGNFGHFARVLVDVKFGKFCSRNFTIGNRRLMH